MTGHWQVRVLLALLILGAPAFLAGCSGHKTRTSVQDQTVVAGHPKTVQPTTSERAGAGAGSGRIAESESLRQPPPAARPSVPAPQEPPASDAVPEERPLEPSASAGPGEAGPLRPEEPELATAEPSFTGKEEAESVATSPAAAAPSLELADVFFDFDEFSIRSDAKMILDANARLLADHADGTVVIEGHCDERGSADYNLVLGERRAQAVKRYLQKHGIQASRMQVMTYGKERPFCTQHNDACWQKNRRAHFVFRQD